MNKFDKLLAKAGNHQDKINALAAPLYSCFGIDHIGNFRISEGGALTNVTSCPERAEFFFTNEIYKECSYLYKPGTWNDCYTLPTMTSGAVERLAGADQKVAWKHPFVIKMVTPDGYLNGFVFASSQKDSEQTNVYLNNLPLLHRFCEHFHKETLEIHRKLEADAVDFFPLLGCSDLSNGSSSAAIDRYAFLTSLGIDQRLLETCKHLSQREKQVLFHLAKSKTTTEIAQAAHISRRTVEYYVDSLKIKFNVERKPMLVQVAHVIVDMGLLSI